SKAVAVESGNTLDESHGEGEFNPRPLTLTSDEQMFAYLSRWKVTIGEGIKVTLAPAGVDFTVAPAEMGVYFPILAMVSGAHLPLPDFAR
ncbi:hypothetical protein, partial [Alteromonas stellipolaris]|uniref:hypothetical protein n=1 Tax=Alteromonas stellipolaris TaxID=233316 RepID=UPI001D5DD458